MSWGTLSRGGLSWGTMSLHRFGRVESVQVDKDGIVRTCTVQYRIVRADLPMEDMRIYFKGLAFKFLRVPVQRLVVILPVEEQGGQGQAVDEKGDEGVQCEETDENNHKELEVKRCEDEVSEVEIGKNYWMKIYKESLLKSQKQQISTITVKLMRKNLSAFVKIVEKFILKE